jgi:hypothetical protein
MTTGLLVAFGLVAFAGCTLRYAPNPPPIESGVVKDLKASGPIQFQNIQSTTAERDLRVPPYTVKVNLYQYTESVIRLIRRALEEKGISFSNNAEKVVRLAVIDVTMVPLAGGRFRCALNLTVETALTGPKGMEASARSWNFQKAIDYAIADAAVLILNNEEIGKYLAAP